MNLSRTDEGLESLRPLASLVSKSEKAQQKLVPGTWQQAMLRDNLRALRISLELMNGGSGARERWTRDDLPAALGAFASMISRTKKAQIRFAAGTSPHSLLRNRLKALRTAKAAVARELARLGTPEANRVR